MVTTSAGPMRSAGLSLLLLSVFYITDSYPNYDFNMGCGECTLRRNEFFSRDRPIYQCQGCCFSTAYPTTLKEMQTMDTPKNFTSKATCCVALEYHEVQVPMRRVSGRQTEVARVRNHTECHCHTCRHQI